MFKKTVALGAIVTTVCATSTLAHSGLYKSGFLAGAHVGVANGWGTFNGNFNPNQLVGGQSNASGKARKTSAILGILAGYRHVLPESYTLGADISLNFLTNNELNNKLNNVIANVPFPFTNKLSKQYSVVPSVNFGKIFCGRYHAYIGLGLALTRFKQQVNNVIAQSTVSSSKIKVGFVPKVGIEYAATPHLSFVGNLSYEIYSKVNKTFDVSASTGLPGAKYSTSIKPKYINFTVGAIYRF